jgi:CUB/sushi domain-containing protein
MPTSGCPNSHSFSWKTGYRTQDTEDNGNNNHFSSPLHLKGRFNSLIITLNFCIKTVFLQTVHVPQWPSGHYCIFKKGHCPTGFNSGTIKWDDEDSHNANGHGGFLPDGKYNRDTIMHFCCRSDRPAHIPITLPTSRPFFLLAATTSCQRVEGMKVRREHVYWDDEDSSNGIRSTKSGHHPYNPGRDNTYLYFCYYH